MNPTLLFNPSAPRYRPIILASSQDYEFHPVTFVLPNDRDRLVEFAAQYAVIAGARKTKANLNATPAVLAGSGSVPMPGYLRAHKAAAAAAVAGGDGRGAPGKTSGDAAAAAAAAAELAPPASGCWPAVGVQAQPMAGCGDRLAFIVKPDMSSRGNGIYLALSLDGIRELPREGEDATPGGGAGSSSGGFGRGGAAPKPRSAASAAAGGASDSDSDGSSSPGASEAEEEEAKKLTLVQAYLPRPLLMDGRKFDLRIYVLVTGAFPTLRAYIYRQGLIRFATVAYAAPSESNVRQRRMFLTNYAVNKAEGTPGGGGVADDVPDTPGADDDAGNSSDKADDSEQEEEPEGAAGGADGRPGAGGRASNKAAPKAAGGGGGKWALPPRPRLGELIQAREGCKWSLDALLQCLGEQGVDSEALWARIKDVITKTLLAARPSMAHRYRAARPHLKREPPPPPPPARRRRGVRSLSRTGGGGGGGGGNLADRAAARGERHRAAAAAASASAGTALTPVTLGFGEAPAAGALPADAHGGGPGSGSSGSNSYFAYGSADAAASLLRHTARSSSASAAPAGGRTGGPYGGAAALEGWPAGAGLGAPAAWGQGEGQLAGLRAGAFLAGGPRTGGGSGAAAPHGAARAQQLPLHGRAGVLPGGGGRGGLPPVPAPSSSAAASSLPRGGLGLGLGMGMEGFGLVGTSVALGTAGRGAGGLAGVRPAAQGRGAHTGGGSPAGSADAVGLALGLGVAGTGMHVAAAARAELPGAGGGMRGRKPPLAGAAAAGAPSSAPAFLPPLAGAIRASPAALPASGPVALDVGAGSLAAGGATLYQQRHQQQRAGGTPSPLTGPSPTAAAAAARSTVLEPPGSTASARSSGGSRTPTGSCRSGAGLAAEGPASTGVAAAGGAVASPLPPQQPRRGRGAASSASQPAECDDGEQGFRAFELMGLDVILDMSHCTCAESARFQNTCSRPAAPWPRGQPRCQPRPVLLEINQSCSLHTDSDLDKVVKADAVRDAFAMAAPDEAWLLSRFKEVLTLRGEAEASGEAEAEAGDAEAGAAAAADSGEAGGCGTPPDAIAAAAPGGDASATPSDGGCARVAGAAAAGTSPLAPPSLAAAYDAASDRARLSRARFNDIADTVSFDHLPQVVADTQASYRRAAAEATALMACFGGEATSEVRRQAALLAALPPSKAADPSAVGPGGAARTVPAPPDPKSSLLEATNLQQVPWVPDASPSLPDAMPAEWAEEVWFGATAPSPADFALAAAVCSADSRMATPKHSDACDGLAGGSGGAAAVAPADEAAGPGGGLDTASAGRNAPAVAAPRQRDKPSSREQESSAPQSHLLAGHAAPSTYSLNCVPPLSSRAQLVLMLRRIYEGLHLGGYQRLMPPSPQLAERYRRIAAFVPPALRET